MRITRLKLLNYKCFDTIVLEDIGSRIALIGPNGCGKSAVLEAIAALKEFVATYDPNKNLYHGHDPLNGHGGIFWPQHLPLPIRSGQSSATISVEIELDGAEQKFCNTSSTDATIIIKNTGEVEQQVENQKLKELFRNFDPDSGLGVIDYISPHRTFPLQKIDTLNLTSISVNQQRKERIELQKPNFGSAKGNSASLTG